MLFFSPTGWGEELSRLELKLDRGYYVKDLQNTIYLEARIHTGGTSFGQRRSRLNVAMLVDRSGSMEGEKLGETKAMLRGALDQLSSNDAFSIVSYGSDTRVDSPAMVVDSLKAIDPLIESLVAEGGSSLGDGIAEAAMQLRKHREESSINRIFLVSDGKPTKGLRDLEGFADLAGELAAEGIAISAIGLGDAFDEEILYSLASASGGTFQSVPNPDDLSKVVFEELNQLNQAFAKDAVLEIVFDSGIVIDETLGRPAETSRRRAFFRFDHLYPHQELSVILQATQSAGGRFSFDTRIARASLSYTRLDSGEAIRIEESVRARYTDSTEHSFESIDERVLKAACSFEVANTIRKAYRLYDEGKPRRALSELKKTARSFRFIEAEFEAIELDEQLEEINRSIEAIESRALEVIDRKALMSTLYQRTHRGVSANNSGVKAEANLEE
ncbi:MAG: VWA domain-containing protein [Verrucomicrobiota bacterium]